MNCTVVDCEKKQQACGYCAMHYKRWRKYDDPLYHKNRLKIDYHSEPLTTADHKHPLYNTWQNLRRRIYDPAASGYKNYGGRGIKVCPAWSSSFKQFCTDMGDRPTPAHTLDRIDNDGDYTAENCRWATRTEQARNRRKKVTL